MAASAPVSTPPPALVVAVHGILTARTHPGWPDRLAAWVACQPGLAHVRVMAHWYMEFPFPRIAWLRNRRRVRQMVRQIEMRMESCGGAGAGMKLILVGHSNGAWLVHQLAAGLISQGVRIERIIYVAAAVRPRSTGRDIMRWREAGMVGEAEAWISPRDRALGLVDLFPSILTFPWGPAGHSGFPAEAGVTHVQDPAAGHSGWWSPGRREESFRQIVKGMRMMAAALAAMGLCGGCMTMSERVTMEDGAVAERRATVWGTDADALEIQLHDMRMAAIGLNQSEGTRHVGRAITGTATVAGMTAAQLAETRAGVTKHVATEETTRRVATEAARTDRRAIEAAERSMPIVTDPERTAGGANIFRRLFNRGGGN